MWGMFSTVEDIQYPGGCSVLWRMFSNVEDIQYSRGYSVLLRTMLCTVENIITTLGSVQ